MIHDPEMCYEREAKDCECDQAILGTIFALIYGMKEEVKLSRRLEWLYSSLYL